MRINSSTIGMESARRYTSVSKKSFQLTAQSYRGSLKQMKELLQGQTQEQNEKTKTGAENGDGTALFLQNRFQSGGITKISRRNELEALDKIRQQCIQYLMELFGMKKRSRKDEQNMTGASESDNASSAGVSVTELTAQISESYTEEEATSFQTTGSVVTADGRQIDFQLEMEMSRSFQAVYQQSYQMLQQNVATCDPLVINLESDVAAVSDQKFLFDIDNDGILDRISQLAGGSGYLALDKNGDGIINDGSELFGPESGDGFTDLAQYDEDGNGWIDEGDAIWEKLLIWTKDENGKDRLYHVSEKGVGAIGLQHQSTDFSLNSLHNNQTNGIIRSTGIFLYENGGVGTLQHVDMAK